MFECKGCGCTEFEEKGKGPHIGIYCANCGKFDKWKKHSTNPKTKEEYRNEYLDKEPATDAQIIYIKNLLSYTRPSKYGASEIIRILGGEVE